MTIDRIPLTDQPLESIFAEDGPLSHSAPGYRFRPGQARLAQVIDDTMTSRSVLVAEAGTGVGKTYAYLVPILLRQGKSLISTATRHLQDQLFDRDLPRIKAALGVSAQVAVLKGRGNYLCLYRMEQHQEEGRFAKRDETQAFGDIVRFAALTNTGDISECAAVPEQSSVWAYATSTRENCLGQNCPRLDACHVMAARKRATEADLVVVNHHLLCADMALRDEGFGELLPTVDHVVIDEAHALPEIATQFFGHSVSTQMAAALARDVLATGLQHARDAASWPDLCGQIEKAAAELRLLMPNTVGAQAASRQGWDALSSTSQNQWTDCIDALMVAINQVSDVLQINAERHIELAQLHEYSQDLYARLGLFTAKDSDAPVVRWMEASRYSLTLHITPYDIRERFSQELARHQRAWILVSATLAVGGKPPPLQQTELRDEEQKSAFRYFLERMGLEEARTLIAQSPFDFQAQGLLLVPEQAPDPKAVDLTAQLLSQPELLDLIATVAGGVFILCTSHRAVGLAKDKMTRWAANHPDRLLLVQGDSPRSLLIDRFRDHGRAILIGSHSFWEGVDVPGTALSMVFIDKLPFAPPDDPVLEARSRWLAKQGRDPFNAIQLPQAAILLKQGVGRLIRTESDHGLVVIGDKRLADTPYGRRIIQSLPPFRRTRKVSEAVQWLSSIARN